MRQRDLDAELEQSFTDLEINEDQQTSLKAYLELVRRRDEATWQHSVRIGLKGIEVAEFTHIVEPKALYYPGLLHDVGKCLNDPKSLKKTQGFNEKDMQEMKKHVKDGYRMLRGIHDFSARVMLYHHWFQGDRSYPHVLPKPDIDYSRGTGATIAFCGRLLSLMDFYDAATFRRTNKFGADVSQEKTAEQVKELLLEHNIDQRHFINELYEAGIFGSDQHNTYKG